MDVSRDNVALWLSPLACSAMDRMSGLGR